MSFPVISCAIFCLFPCSWNSSTGLFWCTDRQDVLEMGKHKLWAARGLQAVRLQCVQVGKLGHKKASRISSLQIDVLCSVMLYS